MYFCVLQYQTAQHASVHEKDHVFAVNNLEQAKNVLKVVTWKYNRCVKYNMSRKKWDWFRYEYFPSFERDVTNVACYFYPGKIEKLNDISELYDSLAFDDPNVIFGLGPQNGIVRID